MKQGITKYYQTLRIEDVTRVHNRGGSILYTSKEQIKTEDDLENCIRALQHLRVKYLITIGGTETAFSAHKLAIGFRDRSLLLNTSSNINNNDQQNNFNIYNGNNNFNFNKQNNGYNINEHHDTYSGILITHVPKTIFNDLPLPSNCYTFGYSTAREIGCKIVADLSADAKSMNRWYIITTIGAKSGHLTLGIGTASAATICLIPEEFEHQKKSKFQKTNEEKKRKDIQMTVKSLLHDKYKDFMEQQDIPTELITSLLDKEYKDDQHNDIDDNKDNDNNDQENDEEKTQKKNLMNGHLSTNDNIPNAAKKSNRYLNDSGVDFKEYVDVLDATMIKRAAEGKYYGVAVIGEGLVDLLKQRDLDKYFNGRKDKGHELLGLTLKEELEKRWSTRKNSINMRTKFVGFELRSVCIALI